MESYTAQEKEGPKADGSDLVPSGKNLPGVSSFVEVNTVKRLAL
jgi:hypothetical protein